MSWADIALEFGGNTPETTNQFGVSSDSKHYADNTFAAITRANWAQSRPQLQSVLGRLTYDYNDPNGRQKAIQGAAQNATQGIEQSRTDFFNNARSTGLPLAPDQQAAATQRFDDASRVARIDAMNRGSRSYDDMKNQIALGG